MLLQKFAVVRDASQPSRLQLFQREGERHLAVRMMVPINLAVGDHMHKFASPALAGKSC